MALQAAKQRLSSSGLHCALRARLHESVRKAGRRQQHIATVAALHQDRAQGTAQGLFERQLSGKSFLCTQCGKCCSAEGEVWASTPEAQAIADALGLPGGLDEFLERYTRQPADGATYTGWHMFRTHSNGSQDCVFLENKLCSIHTVRPSQCSTYPWWPELMEPTAWEWEKKHICEGFDHPDAPPLDTPDAAVQLQVATRDLQVRLLSRQMGNLPARQTPT